MRQLRLENYTYLLYWLQSLNLLGDLESAADAEIGKLTQVL